MSSTNQLQPNQSSNAFQAIRHDWAPYVVQSGPMGDGWHIVLTFRNGYSASIICHQYSYGIEMAVMRDGVIVYDTPITSDVLGWLTPNTLNYNLHELQKLPQPKLTSTKLSKLDKFKLTLFILFVLMCGIVGTLLSNAGLQR